MALLLCRPKPILCRRRRALLRSAAAPLPPARPRLLLRPRILHRPAPVFPSSNRALHRLLLRRPLPARPDSSIGHRSSTAAPDSSSVPTPPSAAAPPSAARGRLLRFIKSDGNGSDVDKDKDDGRSKANKANKEEDDKMRTTTANVAARAAVGGMMYSYLHSVIFLS
ncbi:uncharacterized protein LOC109847902 [Asparagus officinalis]|uniref:uncharacterized protein LOC109847902 n=1 Tax=Asparagus officinalis TaxID=4686 RepID=UPI00098E451E|nr:uncharacterized protein LOC109847902 [Asparagus officinalis]